MNAANRLPKWPGMWAKLGVFIGEGVKSRMTPSHEVTNPEWALAYGLIGDRDRVCAVFLVTHEGMSERQAARKVGVSRTTVQNDRRRFRERLEQYQMGMSPN